MVGRDAALEKVRQQLLAGKPTSIGQTALFQGIGGRVKLNLQSSMPTIMAMHIPMAFTGSLLTKTLTRN